MRSIGEALEKKNLSLGIFGVGKSNLGVLEYARRKNPSLRLTVRSDGPVGTDLLKADRVLFGDDALRDIDEDVLFLSPSVKRCKRELDEAVKRGVLLSSDAELFFKKTDISPICITGSDGKSSTTRLISDALSFSGIKASPCGNYGKSLCSVLETDIFPVVELSSFQLSCLCPKSSRAVITNVTPNHLNWHSSFEEYVSAKMNITKNAEKIIFDCDSATAASRLNEREIFAKTSLEKTYTEMKTVGGSELYVTFSDGIIYVNGSPSFDVSKAKKKEAYTLRNFMLCTAACLGICQNAAIDRALNSFTGLRHRAETFFEKDGIKFIDSSIDSSPERTIKTLSALNGSVTVIIGGMSKGLPLDNLAKRLPSLASYAVLLGEVGAELKNILQRNHTSSGFGFSFAENMRDAVITAKALTPAPATVILSPAATSFDSYKSFEERGDDFKKIVYSL